MKRKTLWFFWRCLLATTVAVLVGGCHWVTGGGYTESKPDETLILKGICDKGTFKCNGEFLLECAADQRSWIKKSTCASKEQCDSKAGVCTVCPQADMLRCAGANREVCSPDRARWMVKEPCPSADTCSPTVCGDCTTPGAFQCALEEGTNKNVLKQCVDKRWVTQSYCPNDDICMATKSMAEVDPNNWVKDKCAGKCTPGDVKCDGSMLYRCPSTGVEWMHVAPCANEALCKLTLDKIKGSPDMGATIDSCEQGCGTPGAPRCENNALQRCSDNRLQWETVMQCQTGLQCSTNGQGSCIVCTPGEYQCNGAQLQICNEQRVWELKQECAQAALCKLYPDANGTLTNGACEEPACARPGTYFCASEKDPKVTPGARLYFCDMDQTSVDPRTLCPSPALCNAPDGKCWPQSCVAGETRCNPSAPLEFQTCRADLTGWQLTKTCAAGQFCNAAAPDAPCQTECPAAAYCSDRFLMNCSPTTGVKQRAECKTRALCECALTNSCPAGVNTDGCGVPVCGDNLANFRCTDTAGTATQGPLLQACKPGRDGWVTTPVTDCTSAALCYPGQAPNYTGGYCATCPVAGEVACNGSATRTCSADRKSWTAQTNCGFGCVADASTTDYCAACMVDEKRCSGDSKQLLACSMDRKSTPVQQDCPFGCINSGTADFCATCGDKEKRCDGTAPGASLRTCAADRKGFGTSTVCANGCFEVPGTADDRCTECVRGKTECSGGGVRTCGDDGTWGAVTACANGCAVDAGVAFCSGCAEGERRCSGSTLQQCSADRKTLTTVETCSNGCMNSGTADYCAACAEGELRCMGTELRSCSADRRTLTAVGPCEFGCMDRGTTDYCAACAVNERRCADNAVQTCTTDRTGLGAPSGCTNLCHDSGTMDYCGDCRPGASRCGTADGTRQICGQDGRWPAAVACTNGNDCYGTAPNAYCGDCKPGDKRCSGSAIQTCGPDGRWPTTSSETCNRGCIDSGDQDYCATCSAGDKTCSGTTLLECNPLTGRYATTGTTCDKGCAGTAPTAACAQCLSGEFNCAGTTRQNCVAGRWSDLETCGDGCINNGTADFCAECAAGDAQCVDSNTSRRTCSMGRWGDPVACPNNACVGKDCAACSPGTVQCAANDSTSYRMCSNSGTWGTPMRCPNSACFNDACVECMPNSEECTDATHLRTCSSSGAWEDPEECTNHSCLNDQCVDCVPNATKCADSERQQVCNSSGRWGTATACATNACVGMTCTACRPNEKQCNAAGTQVRTCSAQGQWLATVEDCDNGCIDNGIADRCQECADGASECLDTMTLRVCEGSWEMQPCAHNCFDGPGSMDYCRDCSVGASECIDKTHRRACDAEGHWGMSETCEHHCLETTGTCVACEPGTTMCEDEQNQRLCSASGAWSEPDLCPNGCVDGACAPAGP